MRDQELAPGLWRWTTFHPEWRHVVGSVCVEATESLVLIDPLIPEDGADRFWTALDRDLGDGRPLHVLVTVFWHTRSTNALRERYGARVWAPVRGRAAIERRAGVVTDVFRPGDPLPGGIAALATARATEVLFWLPEQGALVAGDVLLGTAEGGLRLCPQSWLPSTVTRPRLAESIRPALALPLERVVVSHGEPVVEQAPVALAAALDGA